MFTRKSIVIGSVALVILVAGITTWALLRHTSTSVPTGSQQPNYATLAPQGRSIEDLGGWQRISPPESDPVYAYADTIDGVAVSVSQQPLPTSFKNDPDGQVAELAKSYSATETMTAGQTTVYIGTSAKGPQSVIFTKAGLLILIKSQAVIENDAWTDYIESLS